MNGTAADTGERQSQTASVTAFAAEKAAQNSNTGSEKTKNRHNPAEISVKSGFAGEAAGEYQRIEAKKTVSGGKDGQSKLDEIRSRRRSVEARDFRGSAVTAESLSRDGIPRDGPARGGDYARLSGDASAKEITLELRLPNQGQESSSAATTWETKASQALENMLARELHQNFNNDIVRHASVALRDGNEGTIKLALKPESLGNVKIRLELADNKIIGHIVVESEEALRAFQKEISSLEKAFRDSGFEAANLEMSLAADGRGADQQWQEAEASRFLTGQFAASRYDAAIEQMDIPLTLDVYQQGAMAINMLV
jgi:flagellar hook-length control protein FliK